MVTDRPSNLVRGKPINSEVSNCLEHMTMRSHTQLGKRRENDSTGNPNVPTTDYDGGQDGIGVIARTNLHLQTRIAKHLTKHCQEIKVVPNFRLTLGQQCRRRSQ